MTIHTNDPNYTVSYTPRMHAFLMVENVKIKKDNKNTNHIFTISYKSN